MKSRAAMARKIPSDLAPVVAQAILNMMLEGFTITRPDGVDGRVDALDLAPKVNEEYDRWESDRSVT